MPAAFVWKIYQLPQRRAGMLPAKRCEACCAVPGNGTWRKDLHIKVFDEKNGRIKGSCRPEVFAIAFWRGKAYCIMGFGPQI